MENKIIFSAQHNGKGKNHLIPDNEKFGDKELCGTSGTFLFTSAAEIWLENGKFYEVFDFGKHEIPSCSLEAEYCKKCIKKAKTHYEKDFGKSR